MIYLNARWELLWASFKKFNFKSISADAEMEEQPGKRLLI